MNNEDFENQLRSVPFKRLPGAWREEILSGADRARRTTIGNLQEESSNAVRGWLARWLWPSPAFWGGLGAVWLIIAGANLTASRSDEPVTSEASFVQASHPSSPTEQRALLSQLLDSDTTPAAPVEPAPPRRRSERRLEELAACTCRLWS